MMLVIAAIIAITTTQTHVLTFFFSLFSAVVEATAPRLVFVSTFLSSTAKGIVLGRSKEGAWSAAFGMDFTEESGFTST